MEPSGMNTFLGFIFNGKETEVENKIQILDSQPSVHRGWRN